MYPRSAHASGSPSPAEEHSKPPQRPFKWRAPFRWGEGFLQAVEAIKRFLAVPPTLDDYFRRPKRGSYGGKKRNAAHRRRSGWVSGTPKGTHFTRGKVLELDGLLIAAEYPGLKAYLKIGDPGMV